VSGVVVIDLDPKNGGLENWDELEAMYGPVDTKEVATPSTGRHLYFQAPEDIELKSTAGQIAPGIDTRAEGAYVVIPPSIIDGRAYTVINDVPPALLPDWLLNLWPWGGATAAGTFYRRCAGSCSAMGRTRKTGSRGEPPDFYHPARGV
jgi:Bifunctional DNA primase/polymerase, N-terminal